MEFRIEQEPTKPPATLGDVLYGNNSKPLVSEAEWARLVQSIAAGDQLALHALYERAHRVVFTLIVRIVDSRTAAEELVLDVFYAIWKKASGYDPRNGTVLGWIMNQARSRALDSLRFERRKKRVDPFKDVPLEESDGDNFEALVGLAHDRKLLERALTVLTADERRAIEMAFFSDMTYADVALRLTEPQGTIKTRIRSGLHKLRLALSAEARNL
jgi:RNA polymerase sigma-70 factor, ECF subfamily